MEFSIEMLEKMADLMAEEVARVMAPEEAILGVEEGIRMLTT